MNFISQLWKDVTKNGKVWLVVENDSHFPFIEPPDEEEMPDFGTLMAFSTEEGAADYRKHIIELNNIRPSQIAVGVIKLEEIWEMVEELKLFCLEELGTKLRIELVHATEGENILAHDTLYLQEELPN